MSKDKEQSENMERSMSSVQYQPPQRERRGPINQMFPTPFEWKIPNIRHVVLKAGGFVSEPFYLFSIGYKFLLKIQAELFFFRVVRVYIKVVPGEFDESLSWPCKEKVRVTLVYQNPLPGKRENISQVIDFEKGMRPCSRPLHDDDHDYRLIFSQGFDDKSALYSENDTILIRVNKV